MRFGLSALALSSKAGATNAGVSRFCAGLIDSISLLSPEHEFVVLTAADFEPSEDWKGRPNLKFIQASGPFAAQKTLWEIFFARRALAGEPLDAYLSTAHALPVGLRIPRAMIVHDMFPFTLPQFFSGRHAKVVRIAMTMAARAADVLICNSQHTKSELQRVLKVPERRCAVVLLALGNIQPRSTTPAPDLTERFGIPTRRYLFTVSTLEPRKNLERLVEAFALIANEPGNEDLSLAIAGAKGWKDSEIFHRVEALGIAERTVFLGYVPDEILPALFAQAELFVMPSLAEGFGLPILEAMHFGAPVASSNAGALPEVGGQVPVYFDPADSTSIAKGLRIGLRKVEDGRDQWVNLGLEQAKRFSWIHTASGVLEQVVKIARS